MDIEKKEEHECSLTDKNCLPHTFAGKKGEYKRVDPYLKDGKCVAHGLPNLNITAAIS